MIVITILILLITISVSAQNGFQKDTISTSKSDLVITFIGHGSLMFTFDHKVIYADPWSKVADYSKMPEADIILITHHHGDHCNPAAVEKIRTDSTKIILTKLCAEKISGGNIMGNGVIQTIEGIKIKAVPAYNLVHMRDDGKPYHVKGECNGYVVWFGDKKVYIAGDTENVPEMKNLKNIDIAFLPMNLPYTMTPEMAADAAKSFKPKILYPYHYGETDVSKFLDIMKDVKDIEIRVRKMK